MEGMMATLRGERVRRLLSVRGLARRAGVAPTTVHLIETGQRAPQYLTIHKLSQALGVDPVDIDEFRDVLEETQRRGRKREAGA